MVSEDERKTSEKFIQEAIDEKDKIIIGGSTPPGMSKGYFLSPTIIEVGDQKSPLIQEEISGRSSR